MEKPKDDNKLSTIFKLIYASPRLATLSFTFLIQVNAVIMYEFAGASLGQIAFFTALGRSFDTLTDPLMGWITDSTRSRFGRRRPYMFIGSFGYAICFVLFMSPPSGSSTLVSAWYGLFFILFYAFDTLGNVPYVALGPELTSDPNERDNLFFFCKLTDSFGIVLAVAGPLILDPIVGKDSKYQYLAVILGLIYLTAMQTVVYTVKEKPPAVEEDAPPFVPSVLKSVTTKPFKPLLIGWALDACSTATLTATLPFFITYIVKPENPEAVIGICTGAVFVSAMISMPFFLYLTKKFGKFPVWLGYNVLNAITCAAFILVGEGDTMLCIVCAVLNGLPLGGNFLLDSILSDVIDYDEFLNGTRSEGAFTVFSQIIPKFVSIPATIIPLSILGIIGFVPSVDGVAQTQTSEVIWAIRMMFVFIPTTCLILSFLVKSTFPINSPVIARKIALGIVAHEQNLGHEDPLTGMWMEIENIEPEDLEWYGRLNHFFHRQLVEVLKKGTFDVLSWKMDKLLIIGSALFAFFLTGLIFTYDFLEDSSKSSVPAFFVLMAGISFSMNVMNLLRLFAVRQLKKQFPTVPVKLIKKLLVVDFPEEAEDDEEDSDISPTASFEFMKSKTVDPSGVNVGQSVTISSNAKQT
jgi:Na+/melibiose symporter-like transporter